MVDETAFGTRDAKGHFVPDQRVGYGLLFDWPTKPVKIFKWFFGFPGYLFDRWFGTFHDGSWEATDAMRSKKSTAAVEAVG